MMDRRGVIGLPVRLAVAFVIISVSVPLLTAAADEFREDTEIEDMRADVDSIIRNADDLYFAGTGSSCTVPVTVKPGYEIRIGGEEADAFLVCILKGGSVRDKTYAENPPIRFLGDAVEITGRSELHLECVCENGIYGVRVTSL